MTWRRNVHLWRREWHRTVNLEDGWKVRMDFWFWNYPEADESQVKIALIAYRGLYLHKWTWRKEGNRIGPGGTVIASTALELLSDVERFAPSKAKHEKVEMAISGANIPFYLLYRQVLSRRGYEESEETSMEYSPVMMRSLR